MTDHETPSPPEWTTLTEASEAVGVSSKTIRRALKAGTIASRRSGESPTSAWLVNLPEVKRRWGPGTVKPAADPAEVTALAVTLETFAEMLNQARQDEAAARERAARAEAENEHLRERLAELRAATTEPPTDTAGTETQDTTPKRRISRLWNRLR